MDRFIQWSSLHLMYALVITSITILLLRLFHNLYLHPLANFPGPRLAALSSLPAVYWTFRGKLHIWTAKQHETYGPVVRLRPMELSFIESTAWKEIYSFRQGKSQMPKIHRTKPINGRPNLMSATDDEHARQRKLLAHAFSDLALREQEPLVVSHIDLLVSQFTTFAKSNDNVVDIQRWLTFATFDIIADLSFGKPFGSLETGVPVGWVGTFKHAIKQGVLFTTFKSLWPDTVAELWQSLVGKYVQAKRHQQGRYAAQAIKERLQKSTERPDFVSYCLQGEDLKGVTEAELTSMFTIIALAGCESPATALSGALFYLLRNPNEHEKLKSQVRSIPTDSDITGQGTSQMPLLNAVINESMRLYPPVPAAMDRVVPSPGAKISGHWIPPNTQVGIPQYAANRSPHNFSQPESFIPARFLQDETIDFEKNVKGVLQPFSMGPRNCIGQNLARLELRLILAKLLWHFDLELCCDDDTWITEQKAFGLWDKDPLMVKISLRK